MDIRCTRCGEPWDTDYVWHDDPEAFERHGACITRCPCCKGKRQRLSKRRKRIADAAAVIADLCGEDVDAAASMMDELGEMEL